MELIGLSGAPRTPELELIGSAIDDAMARIRFFRVAFGAARAGETLSERELREILTAIYGGGRLSVEWQVTGELPRQDAKLAFLLLNCAETALPLGGVLTVRHSGEEWDISGEGRKLTIDTEIWQVLDQPMSSDLLLPPSRVQFALLAKESAVSGRRARLSMSPDMLQFTLSLTRA